MVPKALLCPELGLHESSIKPLCRQNLWEKDADIVEEQASDQNHIRWPSVYLRLTKYLDVLARLWSSWTILEPRTFCIGDVSLVKQKLEHLL